MRTVLALLTMVLATVAAATPTAAASGASCLTVQVGDPIQLPDGSLHAAGRLTLCLSRVFSPVAGLHRVAVNGMPVGLLMSRVGRSEGGNTREPVVQFRRDGLGRLHLVGYSYPAARGRSRTFLLGTAPQAAPAAMVAALPLGSQAGRPPDVGAGAATQVALRTRD